MNAKYIYFIVSIVVIVILGVVYFLYYSKPKQYGMEYLNGYWVMQVQDEDGTPIDEQVLYVSNPKSGFLGSKKLTLVYAYDEDEEPLSIPYMLKEQKSKYYRNHEFFLTRVNDENSDSPENLKIELDTINGTLKLLDSVKDDVSYGAFYKDCSV